MWDIAKKLLAKSKLANRSFGDVVFDTPEIKGASSHSFLQWRLKKSMEGGRYFVGLRMRADAYAGPDGSPINYMTFDIADAERLRLDLEQCISEYYRLTREASEREVMHA